MNFNYKNNYSRPIQNSEPPTLKGPHPEHAANVKIAENFCIKVEKKMHPGMRVYVTGSPELPKSLMYVCWKPPKEHPAGNYATPIFLNDTTSNINKKIEGVFSAYMRKAGEWFQRNSPQTAFLDDGLNILDRLV